MLQMSFLYEHDRLVRASKLKETLKRKLPEKSGTDTYFFLCDTGTHSLSDTGTNSLLSDTGTNSSLSDTGTTPFLSGTGTNGTGTNYYTPRKLCLWWGILFSRCPCVCASVRPSVHNILFF